MKPKVNYLLVHSGPHLDEAVGVEELRAFGHKRFDGTDIAEVFFKLNEIPEVSDEHLAWNAPQLLDELGILCIGCLGDRGALFDEHGEKRSEGKAACMLIAEYLDIATHPDWKDIIQFANHFDQKSDRKDRALIRKERGRPNALIFNHDIRAWIRAKNRLGHPSEEVLNVACEFVRTKVELARSRRLNRQMVRDVGQWFESDHVPSAKICLVEADGCDLPVAANNSGATVSIVCKSSGELVIVTNGAHDMSLVVTQLRIAEAKKRGWDVPTESEADGEHCAQVSNLYFHPATHNIICDNSKRVIDVPTVALDPSEIVQIVQENIR